MMMIHTQRIKERTNIGGCKEGEVKAGRADLTSLQKEMEVCWIRHKRRGKEIKGTKGQLGIEQKIEGEMRKLRQITRKGSIRMRCTVGAMYDYRERRDREREVRVAREEFRIFSFFSPVFSPNKKRIKETDSFSENNMGNKNKEVEA